MFWTPFMPENLADMLPINSNTDGGPRKVHRELCSTLSVEVIFKLAPRLQAVAAVVVSDLI